MLKVSLPFGLALASACWLPLAAPAVPIQPANAGVATSVPDSPSGPRRPGLIQPTPSGDGSVSEYVNRRGRPRPGVSKSMPAGDGQRPNVAETSPRPEPSQL